mgnify:CR=1 FL=1
MRVLLEREACNPLHSPNDGAGRSGAETGQVTLGEVSWLPKSWGPGKFD